MRFGAGGFGDFLTDARYSSTTFIGGARFAGLQLPLVFLGLSAHGDTCGLRKRRHFKAWHEHFKAKEGEGLLTPVEKQSLSPKVEERQLPGSNIDGGDVREEQAARSRSAVPIDLDQSVDSA